MRWVVLAVLGLACPTACEVTAEDVRPTCDAWRQVRDSVEAGGPQVIFAGDTVQHEAEESGIQHLEDLATNLNNEFSTWLLTEAEAGRPFGPELVKALDEFESYCAEEGAPVG